MPDYPPAYECVGGPWDGKFWAMKPEANVMVLNSFDPWTSRSRDEGEYRLRDGKLYWRQYDA
jgi:hypothetical protein